MSEHIPLFVEMANCKHLNLTDIAVYGAVYFYSFQGEGTFNQAYETIAGRLAITKNTAKASLKKLADLGIINDLTPERRNAPHDYKPVWIPEIGIQKLVSIADEGYQKLVSRIPEIGIQKAKRIPKIGTNKNNTNKYKNGNGKTLPPAEEPVKPLVKISDVFIALTNIKMPTRKTDVKFWWSSIKELYNLANNDVGICIKLIEYTVKKMRKDQLTISNPNSIINVARDVMAQRAAEKLKTETSSQATITTTGGVYV